LPDEDGAAGASAAGAEAEGGGGEEAGAEAAAESEVKSLKAAMSEALLTTTHSNVPTGTSLLPPGTRILARNPSSGVSKPIVALSVSISASRSPSDN